MRPLRRIWLTPSEKLKLLARLKLEILDEDIDKEILPFLKKFNSFPFVVSEYCCYGHPAAEREGSGAGYLMFLVEKAYCRRLLKFLIKMWHENILSCVEITDCHFIKKPVAITARWQSEYRKEALDKIIEGLEKCIK